PKKSTNWGLGFYEVEEIDDEVTQGKRVGFLELSGKSDKLFIKGDVEGTWGYKPNDTIRFAVYRDGVRFSDIYELTIEPQLTPETRPIVKANASETTTQKIGLTLKVPQALKNKSEGLAYEVKLSTNVVTEVTEGGLHNTVYLPEISTTAYKTNLMWETGEYHNREKVAYVLYQQNVTEYFGKDDSCVIDVTVPGVVNGHPELYGAGFPVDYTAEVTLRYMRVNSGDMAFLTEDGKWVRKTADGSWEVAAEDNSWEPLAGDPPVLAGGGTATLEVSTKDQKYEKKLTLKKAATKVYTADDWVTIATVGFGKDTTVRTLDHVELADASGRMVDNFYLNDAGENGFRFIEFDPGCSSIAIYPNYTDERDEIHYLEPGTYTVTAYARAGNGKHVTASMKVKVLSSIESLTVTPSTTRVVKRMNKPASFKLSVGFTGINGYAPATKKAAFSIYAYDGSGDIYDPENYGSAGSYEGKISINAKKKTVTLSKNLLVKEKYIRIKAEADDYPNNFAYAWSDPILLTTEETIPHRIRLMHYEYDRENGKRFLNEDSGIRDGDKDVDTGNASRVYPLVYDGCGEVLDPSSYTLKLTNLRVADDGGLIVTKPGRAGITATMKDGGKKSCSISFTTVYGDSEFQPAVTVYSARRDWDRWENAVIDARAEDGKYENPYPLPCPVYVHVGAFHRDGAKSLLDHSLSVTGGKILSKEARGDEIAYAILPGSYETRVTINDKTKDRPDAQKTKVIAIINSAAMDSNNTKAPSVKTVGPDTVYDNLSLCVSSWDPDITLNSNMLTYEIKDVPEGADTVRISVADPGRNDDKWTFAKYLGKNPADDDNVLAARGSESYEITTEGGKKVVKIDLYEERKEDCGSYFRTEYHMDRIKAGDYTFYMTVGKEEAGVFTALSKPAVVKVKVKKIPKLKISFKTDESMIREGRADIIPSYGEEYGLAPWLDLRSELSNGVPNAFADIFEMSCGTNRPHEILAVNAADPVHISMRRDDDALHRTYPVSFGKKGEASLTLEEIKLLKNGGIGNLYVGDNKHVTRDEEKTVYKKWIKANSTGYLKYNVVLPDGSRTGDRFQKIKLDLDKAVQNWTPGA
ncbi:MAG: hypothetical protein K6F53_10585, partial [Lachnospiraceae bacterium]|nr:hypothetical protein [Lachnospiraceae bacterium]